MGKLSRINRPLKIGFGDMLKLMQQCNQVEKLRTSPKRRASDVAALYERNSDVKDEEQDDNIQGDAPIVDNSPENQNRGILSGNPFSLLSGVFPGTKWCGTGDIAKNFHDLGEEKDMDRCCRGKTFSLILNETFFLLMLIVSLFLQIMTFAQSKYVPTRHVIILQITQFTQNLIVYVTIYCLSVLRKQIHRLLNLWVQYILISSKCLAL